MPLPMLKLEAGKSYRCRDGSVITLEQSERYEEYLVDPNTSLLYDTFDLAYGHLVFGDGGLNSGKDIIEQVNT